LLRVEFGKFRRLEPLANFVERHRTCATLHVVTLAKVYMVCVTNLQKDDRSEELMMLIDAGIEPAIS
jgi:hypothetical protein